MISRDCGKYLYDKHRNIVTDKIVNEYDLFDRINDSIK